MDTSSRSNILERAKQENRDAQPGEQVSKARSTGTNAGRFGDLVAGICFHLMASMVLVKYKQCHQLRRNMGEGIWV